MPTYVYEGQELASVESGVVWFTLKVETTNEESCQRISEFAKEVAEQDRLREHGALLVLNEFPESCIDCYLCWDDEMMGDLCIAHRKVSKNAEDYRVDLKSNMKPSWCPLKPMPERKIGSMEQEDYTDGLEDGWNDCLDYIEGEDDDE